MQIDRIPFQNNVETSDADNVVIVFDNGNKVTIEAHVLEIAISVKEGDDEQAVKIRL